MAGRQPSRGSGDQPATRDRETFRPTSGRVTGVLALAMAAGVVVLWVLQRDQGQPDWTVAAAICFGAVCWATLLRPGVARWGDTLRLRHSFETVWVPLRAVDEVVVGPVLAVRVGEQTLESAAIGLSLRQMHRDRRPGGRPSRSGRPGPAGADAAVADDGAYARMVEDRLRQAVRSARLAGETAAPGEVGPVVVRRPAWPEIAVTTVSAVATVVLLVL